MISSELGPLDGNSWDELCQAVYKKKYKNYQEMVPSPGDWGIEGFMLGDGIAIQCYCPSREYDTATLYAKQRDKITKDLQKLSDYKEQIRERIGNDKIKYWIFITPRVAKNDLLAHSRVKEKEIKSLNLDFIHSDFQILIHDIGHYLKEFREILTLKGKRQVFSSNSEDRLQKVKNCNEYDDNIDRKNKVRSFRSGNYNLQVHQKLNNITSERFLLGDSLLRKIELQSPELYKSLNRVINQYESEIEELSLTWEDSPSKLIEKVKAQLKARLEKDEAIENVIADSDLDQIVDHMMSKWLALCPLEILQ